MAFVQDFDNSPMAAILNGIIEAPGKAISKVANMLGQAGGAGESRGSDSGSSIFGSIREAFSGLGGGASSPEPAIVQEPAVAINAPAQQMGKYDVSPAELGTFAPPAVGAVSASRGEGMVV